MKKCKYFLSFLLILVMIVAMSLNAFATTSASDHYMGYDVVTTAAHSTVSAYGSFGARVSGGGQVISPTCSIAVTAINTSGAGCAYGNGSGYMSCNASATPLVGTVGGSIAYSTFLDMYHATVTD